MDTTDPMPSRTDFAIGHREKIFAQRCSEGLKDLLWGVEGDTSHQQKLATHMYASVTCWHCASLYTGDNGGNHGGQVTGDSDRCAGLRHCFNGRLGKC